MKRHIIVAIIAAVLVIAIFIASWVLYPGWQKLGAGGVLTLLAAIIVGVVTVLQNVVSIWKDLSDDPKSSGLRISRADDVYLGNATTTNIPKPNVDTAANNTIASAVPETSKSDGVAEENKVEESGSKYAYWAHSSASEIFQGRLAEAFPGLRDVETIHGEEAINRLEMLLHDPLNIKFQKDNFTFIKEPFWWLRGYRTSGISRIVKLAPDSFLLDDQQFKIDYITAVRSFPSADRNFIYVQVLPEQPTGLYKYAEGWLDKYLKEHLQTDYYFYEAYGVWKDKLITTAELQDSAAIINGKPTEIFGAEFRIRFLTPYNFVICGQDHVLNNKKFDQATSKFLNFMLMGAWNMERFMQFVEKLPPRPSREDFF